MCSAFINKEQYTRSQISLRIQSGVGRSRNGSVKTEHSCMSRVCPAAAAAAAAANDDNPFVGRHASSNPRQLNTNNFVRSELD